MGLEGESDFFIPSTTNADSDSEGELNNNSMDVDNFAHVPNADTTDGEEMEHDGVIVHLNADDLPTGVLLMNSDEIDKFSEKLEAGEEPFCQKWIDYGSAANYLNLASQVSLKSTVCGWKRSHYNISMSSFIQMTI